MRALRLMFRRRTPAPGEHDARALEIANRRIWRLEMDKQGLQHRLERADRAHGVICSHAQQLTEALFKLDVAERSEARMYQRLRNHLASLQRIGTDVTQPIAVVDSDQEPR